MCGLAGRWIAKGQQGDVIHHMINAMTHRGPDSKGFWESADGAVKLGHARLAIIDVSSHGDQPMVSDSGRYMIVFNGEIYNHLSIRRLIETAKPRRWRGHSDTETLLAAIDCWGLEKSLQVATGMFALALWDKKKSQLSLARDRMGEKPLYYANGSNGIAFASELKALKCCPDFDFVLDQQALRYYFRVGYIPCPDTVYRGVKKLQPGSILTYTSVADAGVQTFYWEMPVPDKVNRVFDNDNACVDELERLLERSIQEQSISDVALGAFLSGGIDSSVIASIMQRQSSKCIRTFTMGFHDHSDDESKHARKIADYLGTEHTELMVSAEDVLSTIPNLPFIYDEPFADSSQVPAVLISKITRKHVTVALSGDGGDELFGGYNRYLTAVIAEKYFSQIPYALKATVAGFAKHVPSRYWDYLAHNGLARRLIQPPPSLGEKVVRLSEFFSASSGEEAYTRSVSQWLNQDKIPILGQRPRLHIDDIPGVPLPQKMMYWDLKTYLPDDILVKIDRAAMASSLETRVPFLDHRIVEFSLQLPMNQKIRRGKTKWILRQLLARHIPEPLFSRPKQGFVLPIADWLRGPLRDWSEDLLASISEDSVEFIDIDSIRKSWREHLNGEVDHHRGLWAILMFQAWLQASTKIS